MKRMHIVQSDTNTSTRRQIQLCVIDPKSVEESVESRLPGQGEYA